MNWIKKLFRKKQEEEILEQPKIEEPEEINLTETDKVCDYCGFPIYGEQKSISKFKKHYHVKPCWRKLLKAGKQELFN